MIITKYSKNQYDDPISYQPISLLLYLGKILESLIAKKIAQYAK
jgi:hypothetical protein